MRGMYTGSGDAGTGLFALRGWEAWVGGRGPRAPIKHAHTKRAYTSAVIHSHMYTYVRMHAYLYGRVLGGGRQGGLHGQGAEGTITGTGVYMHACK